MDPLKDSGAGEWAAASGGGGDYLDFLSRSTGPAEWIALSRVFLPRFVEVRGCVLWDRSYEPGNFQLWYAALKGDVASVEATLNEFRLWMYVDFDDDPASRSNALDLAREIARAWRLSLGDAFPHRAFDVRASETADGPVVGFTSLPGTGG